MSERARFWVQIAVDVLVGASGWVALFLENEEFARLVGEAAFDLVATCYPFVVMLLGALTGYRYCRWRLSKDLGAIRERVEAAEDDLADRPTRDEVYEIVTRCLEEFVSAVVERSAELSKTSDDRLRERMASGEVSGFEARVLGEVLALDAHPRRWLRSALEEGYVDVEDRVVGDYDRLGHFRNLVTAAETGLPGEWGHPMTRYVLNDGVRDVLESFPEVFELVDRDDEEIARIVSECGGKPYDPETAAYRRVSR